jgi:hypothetical protein
MTATLLAHAGHVAHGGTAALIGVALLLVGAATVLWLDLARARLRRAQNGEHAGERQRTAVEGEHHASTATKA